MTVDISRLGSRLDILYLITREFSTATDIEQALHNVLSALVASVRAFDASLLLFDSEGELQDGLVITTFEVKKTDRLALKKILENGLIAWVQEHRKGTVVNDTGTDERWPSELPQSEGDKAASAVCVPLQIPEQLLGVLTITAPDALHFDDNDLAMLTIIADQAAFALANARLFEAEQHRRRLADTLAAIAHTVNSTLDLNEVLELILEQLSRVIEYDSSSILLYDEKKQALSVQAARNFVDLEDALSVTLPFDTGAPNYKAIFQKSPVVLADVDADPHWIKSSSSQYVKSWIGAPLIARDEVVGILTVDHHKVDKYTEENAKIVAAFADQAATAVANAQTVTRLQNAELTYAALFEDSTDLIIITNYDGLILNLNRKACQILRRPKDALLELTISFINPQLKRFLVQQTKRLKVWRESAIEIETQDAYRQTVPLELKIRQIQYRGKDCVEWVGRDISSRKQIEKMREDLVNMLVHDLRGPIGNLINIIELISMITASTENDPRLSNVLGMAKRSGQALNDMVDSVLDVGRLEEGQVPLQRTMTNLAELFQAVEEQVGPQAVAKGMELTFHPLPKISEAWLDSSLVRRMLTNLVSNAVKYTPEDGHISVKAAVTPANELHFIVSDDGPGISKADQLHIFDKFSRVDYSINTPVGVGLGLAFCKLAAEAHGGSIYVDSEGVPGKGCTFHLTLPIIQESYEAGMMHNQGAFD